MKYLFLLFLSSFLLVACSPEAEAIMEPTLQPVQIREASADPGDVIVPSPPAEAGEKTVGVGSDASSGQGHWPDGEEQLDAQGFVEFAVVPLNLNSPTDTLNFEVELNTHSVDLNMDMASLATLDADNGLAVEAIGWDAPVGGHHVDGVLSFPVAHDDSALLDNASSLTLTIRDVDAPERIFIWNVAE